VSALGPFLTKEREEGIAMTGSFHFFYTGEKYSSKSTINEGQPEINASGEIFY
jgi:hypothetical protein